MPFEKIADMAVPLEPQTGPRRLRRVAYVLPPIAKRGYVAKHRNHTASLRDDSNAELARASQKNLRALTQNKRAPRGDLTCMVRAYPRDLTRIQPESNATGKPGVPAESTVMASRCSAEKNSVVRSPF